MSAEQDRSEGEGPKRKGGTETERTRKEERDRGRTKEEEKGRLETGSARDREETRETAFNYLPTYLPTYGVKNGSFAPASTTPASQLPAADRLSFSSVPSATPFFLVVSLVASVFLAPAYKTYLSRSAFPSCFSLPLFLHDGKTNSPGGRWRGFLPAVVLARARRFECN